VVIETERLILRPLAPADVDELVALGEDPEVARFVGALGRAEAEERVRAAEREWAERGHGMFAVLDRTSGRFRGRAGLKHWPQFDETEVGWVLRRDAWGRGYATEAGRACLEWGFANLPAPYFTAMIHPDNALSIRVAGRLGMVRWRADVLLDSPVIVYAVRRHDWPVRAVAPPPPAPATG
jgi:RimJ/RimL family protein N-acetyltransferase